MTTGIPLQDKDVVSHLTPSRVGTGSTAVPRVTSVIRPVQDTSVPVEGRDEPAMHWKKLLFVKLAA